MSALESNLNADSVMNKCLISKSNYLNENYMESADSIRTCLNLEDEICDIPMDLLHHQPAIQPIDVRIVQHDPLLVTQLIIQRMHLLNHLQISIRINNRYASKLTNVNHLIMI